MTARYNSQILVAREEIVAPPAPRACEDHNWGLPTGVYAVMAACFVGAVTVLATAFSNGMGLSFGIIIAFLLAFFGIPALFVKTSKGQGVTKAPGWAEFRDKGIATATGRTPASEATTLVLLLPVLIFAWAIAVATIAALV
jgi:hypothetical protein